MHPQVAALLAIPQPEQRTPAWYEARHSRLTASDAATALGLNPYETSDALVLKKCGLGERFEGNEATAHGERWEPFVRDKFCAETGLKCYEGGLLPHPTVPFLGGSPDGLLTNEEGTYCALLEIKAPLRRKITGVVPVYYMPQLQLLMDICDLPEAYFVEFKPGDSWIPEQYVVTKVPREEGWLERNLPMLRLFWEKVEYYRAHPDEALELERQLTFKKYAAPQKKRRKNVVDVDENADAKRCLIVPDSQELAPAPVDFFETPRSASEDSLYGRCLISL